MSFGSSAGDEPAVRTAAGSHLCLSSFACKEVLSPKGGKECGESQASPQSSQCFQGAKDGATPEVHASSTEAWKSGHRLL